MSSWCLWPVTDSGCLSPAGALWLMVGLFWWHLCHWWRLIQFNPELRKERKGGKNFGDLFSLAQNSRAWNQEICSNKVVRNLHLTILVFLGNILNFYQLYLKVVEGSTNCINCCYMQEVLSLETFFRLDTSLDIKTMISKVSIPVSI